MRKLFALVTAAALTLSLVACSKTPAASSKPDTSKPSTSTSTSTPATPAWTPDRPITFVVPYGAGGTTDLVARQLAVAMSETLGVSVIVENQAGASGSVGAQSVLDADADGYTLLMCAESLGGTLQVMNIADISYADFSPILCVANDPKVIVVAGDSKYDTLEQLLEDIKSNPNKIQMSYTGPGGSGHIQALIMNELGYEPAMTAYTGGSDCIVAVLGGQVAFTNSNYSTVASYIASGDLKLLAAASTEPLAAHPDVPTMASVIPDSDAFFEIPYTPLSLLASAETPDEVVEALHAAALKAVENATFDGWMTDNCVDKLYEKYPTTDQIQAFYGDWASLVTYLMFDAGVAALDPADFGIERLG